MTFVHQYDPPTLHGNRQGIPKEPATLKDRSPKLTGFVPAIPIDVAGLRMYNFSTL